MPGSGRRPITCKHCGQVSPSLKEHAAHLLAAHREETLARRRELAANRKAQDEKIGAAARTAPAVPPGRARPAHGPSAAIENAGSGPAESARRGGNGHHAAGSPATSAGRCCPTCGGPIPERTGQLVAELMSLGISEDQSFAATRAARRILGPAGSG